MTLLEKYILRPMSISMIHRHKDRKKERQLVWSLSSVRGTVNYRFIEDTSRLRDTVPKFQMSTSSILLTGLPLFILFLRQKKKGKRRPKLTKKTPRIRKLQWHMTWYDKYLISIQYEFRRKPRKNRSQTSLNLFTH